MPFPDLKGSQAELPQIGSSLGWRDRLGILKVRWGIGRMNYSVAPGLYRLGNPDENSPVLVTANYKMTFDLLRSRGKVNIGECQSRLVANRVVPWK